MKKDQINQEKDILDTMLNYMDHLYALKHISSRIDESVYFWEEEVELKKNELQYEDVYLKSAIKNELKECQAELKKLNKSSKIIKELINSLEQVDLI